MPRMDIRKSKKDPDLSQLTEIQTSGKSLLNPQIEDVAFDDNVFIHDWEAAIPMAARSMYRMQYRGHFQTR